LGWKRYPILVRRELRRGGYHRSMSGTRILVACELQSYRQALAVAFWELRSHVEVFEAKKDDLDRELLRLDPDLVVRSGLTARVEAPGRELGGTLPGPPVPLGAQRAW
jgi:hypothetical protein